MSQIDRTNCTLRLVAQAKAEPCSRRCAFWEPGGAVVEEGCLLNRLGVDVHRLDLATYLLEVRERLEQARSLAEAEAAQLEISRRVGLEL